MRTKQAVHSNEQINFCIIDRMHYNIISNILSVICQYQRDCGLIQFILVALMCISLARAKNCNYIYIDMCVCAHCRII